jgi:hypothetical protein
VREEKAWRFASLLAGMAFSAAGTATVHALQYSVGEATHIAWTRQCRVDARSHEGNSQIAHTGNGIHRARWIPVS